MVCALFSAGAPFEESDEYKPGIILDSDKSGNIAGVEMLDASRCMDNLRSVGYAAA